MSNTFPKCGDTNRKDSYYAPPYGCGNRLQPVQYKKPNGKPGVCLVCPVCDSPSVVVAE